MKTYDDREILIFKMIEEIKSLNKEIMGLKHFIGQNIPFCEKLLYDDRCIPPFTSSKQYRKLIEKYDFDFFEDDPIYLNHIEQLRRSGHSKDGYPRSIKE